VLPVTEITGATKNTLVFGGSSRTSEDAIVEIQSTSQGFMYPRMSEAQRGGIAAVSSTVGMIVYQTDGDEGLYIYKSGGWVQII
jgi:hypothetical protein